MACTRARDLLVLPDPSWSRSDSWFRFFDLGQQRVQQVITQKQNSRLILPPVTNEQDASTFAAEGARILAASPGIVWRRPSVDDADRDLMERISTSSAFVSEANDTSAVVGPGASRGSILHALMEELIGGQCAVDLSAMTLRATDLIAELPLASPSEKPDPSELARTALGVYSHPELAPFRADLVAEC